MNRTALRALADNRRLLGKLLVVVAARMKAARSARCSSAGR